MRRKPISEIEPLTKEWREELRKTVKHCSFYRMSSNAVSSAKKAGKYKGHTMSKSNPPNQCKRRMELMSPDVGSYVKFDSNNKMVKIVK